MFETDLNSCPLSTELAKSTEPKAKLHYEMWIHLPIPYMSDASLIIRRSSLHLLLLQVFILSCFYTFLLAYSSPPRFLHRVLHYLVKIWL